MNVEIVPEAAQHAIPRKGVHKWDFSCSVVMIYVFPEMGNERDCECAALIFPKPHYNVLSPNFNIHVSMNDPYIPMISLPQFWAWEYINCSQIHKM
jgi:hypothetical protein